jgi:gluconate 2-dehydrogenase alpha chain
MGDDPAKAVVNKYLQSHELPNLFVTSGAVFPTYFGYNPTHTIEALSYRTSDYIKTEAKTGGSLAKYL